MWGKRCSRNSWKQSLPLWPVQFIQKKVPPCELASAQPRNWKDPKICPAVNIVSNMNRSQTVKSLGFLPFDFLQPEWKGHSLYLLKVTNKQLGYLLVAEEGVTVSAAWVGKLLTSIWRLLWLFLRPGHSITELALKAVLVPGAAGSVCWVRRWGHEITLWAPGTSCQLHFYPSFFLQSGSLCLQEDFPWVYSLQEKDDP